MLIDEISKLHEILKVEIPTLNNGGCIHFAYYMSKRLKELNVPHSVYLFDYIPVYNTYKHFQSVTHVGVYIPGIEGFDGHKFKPFKKLYDYKRKVTLNLDRLRNDYKWCEVYDCNNNQKLEKFINTYINDY